MRSQVATATLWILARLLDFQQLCDPIWGRTARSTVYYCANFPPRKKRKISCSRQKWTKIGVGAVKNGCMAAKKSRSGVLRLLPVLPRRIWIRKMCFCLKILNKFVEKGPVVARVGFENHFFSPKLANNLAFACYFHRSLHILANYCKN
jgi:hypothetical protein